MIKKGKNKISFDTFKVEHGQITSTAYVFNKTAYLSDCSNINPLDLNNLKSISKLYKTLKDKKIKIDFLINNAAIKPNRKKFYKLKNSEIFKIFNINVISVFEMINKFIRQINKKRFVKTIINISSYSSESGGYKISHYASSKSALESLTLSLSKELFNLNIGIYCISPYKILINKLKKNQIHNSKIIKMIMDLIKKNNIKNSGKIFYIK